MRAHCPAHRPGAPHRRGRSLVRKAAAALAVALCAASTAAAAPRPLVLTIDDGPALMPTPPLTAAQRHAALRETLARHRITAVLYVTLNFGADRPEGLALARDWAAAGHLLGNHTVTHPDIDDPKVPMQRYLDEIDACDAAMGTLANWRRWYRPTYLHEGATPERRDALHAHLARRGYRIAPAHLDATDWEYTVRLQSALATGRGDGDAVKREFLALMKQRARQRRDQGHGVMALLLHDNLLTALWLDDIVRLLRDEGYEFVHPDAAMTGPGKP